MGDLVVLEVVSTELEASLICGMLEDAAIRCLHRPSNFAVAAMDGLPSPGPREIVVQGEDLERAREVLALHRR